MSGDVSGCHSRGGDATGSRGWRPGLLNALQCTRQPSPTPKNKLVQTVNNSQAGFTVRGTKAQKG